MINWKSPEPRYLLHCDNQFSEDRHDTKETNILRYYVRIVVLTAFGITFVFTTVYDIKISIFFYTVEESLMLHWSLLFLVAYVFM